jgi:2-hydroxychromene-2-carboxylate isomerase
MVAMGEVIWLAAYRPRRQSGTPSQAERFYFDLACPFTYLAADAVERAFGAAGWTPASGAALAAAMRAAEEAEAAASPRRAAAEASAAAPARRAAVEARAAALGLPLTWPERYPAAVPAAMRVAGYAEEHGRGAAFAIAAARLAFAGGFDLDDPEIIADAAAAAGLPPAGCLQAARETWRDEPIAATGRRLHIHGVAALPALRLRGGMLLCGERQIAGAAATAGLRAAAR